MLSVNSNIGASAGMLAMRNAIAIKDTAVERLSSGFRINSAADDAAGKAVVGKLTKDIQGVNVAIRNASDMHGALSVIDNSYSTLDQMLNRMRELAIQSSSGTYSDQDREKMDLERASLLLEVNNIAESTKFNGRKLLDGTFRDIIAQVGANANESIDVDIEKIEGVRLGRYEDLAFSNNDFSQTTPVSTSGTTVSIPGWTIELSQIALGPDDTAGSGGVTRSIGGFATPTDPTPNPANGGSVSAGDDYAPSSAGTMSYEFADGSMRLVSSGMTSNAGGDVIHGPYITSDDDVALSVGDKVSFNWKAANGADAFDVYAYLLNTADGSAIELLDETANGSTNWAASETTVTTAGDYKFVFISGTFDYTFGRALGASLYIDDIAVDSASGSGPEVVVEYINVLDQSSATTAIDILDVAKEQVATYRAYVGALQNRLTSVITNLTSRSLNQTITKGRIEDADFALESTKLVKQEILSKAASEVVATANKSKEAILSLLQ
jgi:flagellin-like hook-associated protein FlgL